MATLLRNIFAVVGAGIIAALLAVLFEPFFFFQTFAHIGIDSSQWVDPAITALSVLWADETFRLIAAGLTGAAIGAWLHFWATKWERRRAAPPPDQEAQAPPAKSKLTRRRAGCGRRSAGLSTH